MSTQRSFRQAARSIERLAKEMDRRVPSGLRVIGEEIMTDVKASRAGHGVPVREGILRSTGRVKGPDRGEVEISFGGAAAPYALVQHERLDFRHTVGEARYLVRGLDRWKPDGSQGIRALREDAEAGIRAARAAGKIE
jgi:hypothetical protein